MKVYVYLRYIIYNLIKFIYIQKCIKLKYIILYTEHCFKINTFRISNEIQQILVLSQIEIFCDFLGGGRIHLEEIIVGS